MTLFDPTLGSNAVTRCHRLAPLLDCGPHRVMQADRPPQLFAHGLDDHDETTRAVARALEQGLGDREAWDVLLPPDRWWARRDLPDEDMEVSDDGDNEIEW